MRRFVLATLSLALAPAAFPQEIRSLEVYDVESLVTPIENRPGWDLSPFDRTMGFPLAIGSPVFADDENETRQALEEALVLAITNVVDPEGWGHEDASISASDGRLHVRQTPEAQQKIRAYLRHLRGERLRRVDMEVLFVDFPAGGLSRFRSERIDANLGVRFTREDLAAIEAPANPFGAKIGGRTRVEAYPGQRVSLNRVSGQKYVKDVDVTIGPQAIIADPIVGWLSYGQVVDLEATPAAGGDTIHLVARLTSADLAGPVESFTLGPEVLGTIQLPRLETRILETAAAATPGEAVLVGSYQPTPDALEPAGEAAAVETAVFVIPTVREPRFDSAFEPDPGARRVARVVDLGALTRQPPDFPGARLWGTSQGGGEASGGTAFGEEEPRRQLSPEQVIDYLKANVEPDTWLHPKNRVIATGRRILVVNTPEVVDRVERAVSDLVSTHVRLVTLRATFLALTSPAQAARVEEWRQGSGTALEAAQVASLLQSEGTRVLAVAEVTGFERQRVSVSALRDTSVVDDYDTQVAQNATACDPIIGHVLSGAVLDVRPNLEEDTGHVRLDVYAAISFTRNLDRLFDPMIANVGSITMPEVDAYWVENEFVTPASGAFLVALSTRTGSEVYLLLQTAPSGPG